MCMHLSVDMHGPEMSHQAQSPASRMYQDAMESKV